MSGQALVSEGSDSWNQFCCGEKELWVSKWSRNSSVLDPTPERQLGTFSRYPPQLGVWGLFCRPVPLGSLPTGSLFICTSNSLLLHGLCSTPCYLSRKMRRDIPCEGWNQAMTEGPMPPTRTLARREAPPSGSSLWLLAPNRQDKVNQAQGGSSRASG